MIGSLLEIALPWALLGAKEVGEQEGGTMAHYCWWWRQGGSHYQEFEEKGTYVQKIWKEKKEINKKRMKCYFIEDPDYFKEVEIVNIVIEKSCYMSTIIAKTRAEEVVGAHGLRRPYLRPSTAVHMNFSSYILLFCHISKIPSLFYYLPQQFPIYHPYIPHHNHTILFFLQLP